MDCSKPFFSEVLVKTEDIIAGLFCPVDDRLKHVPKHLQGELYPSEILTLGALFTLKEGRFRHFYRWLKPEYLHLFPHLRVVRACCVCSRRGVPGQIVFGVRRPSLP